MPDYVIWRIVASSVLALVSFSVWIWAINQKRIDTFIAGWAIVYMGLGLFGIFEK